MGNSRDFESRMQHINMKLLTAAMVDSLFSDIPSPARKESSSHHSVPSPQMQGLTLTDLVPVSDEDKAEATRIKAQANEAFSSMYKSHTTFSINLHVLISELITWFGDFLGHDFPTAAKLYSEAIEKNPNEPTLWCNRAYARMKLEEFGYALSDASAITQLWLRRIDETESILCKWLHSKSYST